MLNREEKEFESEGLLEQAAARPSDSQGAARGAIELIQHDFGGGVELDEDGNFLTDSRGSEYVGPPSPAVDQAWDYLERGMNIDLHGQEGAEVQTFRWPETGASFTGLEVFHSLHCLNKLRQALYPEAYGHVFAESHGPMRKDHIGHCLNHLRQSIQCHSDLTPMEWERVGNKLILSTKTPHTCRDFDKIHQWALGRMTDYNGLPTVMNGTLEIVA
ncbi:uncharacterized protein PG998_013125 [Apiospora kogelbergensis]|uniref:uncharacterized protein n=1 Tax=Apiospora kogelbergensis TaxID=1337665 RepID=UPI00312FE727